MYHKKITASCHLGGTYNQERYNQSSTTQFKTEGDLIKYFFFTLKPNS